MKIRNRIVSLVLAMVLLVSAIPMSAFAAGDIMYGIGYITGSKVRLRSEANTDSKIVDTTGKGEVVTVISKSGDWYNVIYDLKEGYIHSDYLDVSTTANAELGYGKITGSGVNMRSGAGTSYSRVVKGNKGDKAYIVGISDGWYRVIYSNKVCYIRSDYLDLTEVPYENNASKHSPKFFRGGKYETLLMRLLKKNKGIDFDKTKSVLEEYVVPMDCALIGTKIWELPIPKSAMVVSVVRSGNTLIPDEDLELKYADELFIIMNQNTYPDDNQKIESLIYNNWKEE